MIHPHVIKEALIKSSLARAVERDAFGSWLTEDLHRKCLAMLLCSEHKEWATDRLRQRPYRGQ